jgi:hypothetical protein
MANSGRRPLDRVTILVIGGCLSLVVLSVLVAVMSMRLVSRIRSDATPSDQTAPTGRANSAEVKTGTAIKWQKLDEWRSGGGLMESSFWQGITVGDLDGDRDQEILRLHPRNILRHGPAVLSIIDSSGGHRQISASSSSVVHGMVSWDYDRDVDDEIVLSDGSDAYVLDSNGSQIAQLAGNGERGSNYLSKVDLQGDGAWELVIHDPTVMSAFKVYGKLGSVVWAAKWDYHDVGWGDLDGNGTAEKFGDYNDGLRVEGPNQKMTVIEAPSELGWIDLECFDFDSDGRDEVFDPGSGFFNLATQQFVKLERPGTEPYSSGNMNTATAFGDFDSDGKPDIAMTSGGDILAAHVGKELYIFNRGGKLTYHELFNAPILDLELFKEGSRDRLVILLKGQLLISP